MNQRNSEHVCVGFTMFSSMIIVRELYANKNLEAKVIFWYAR